MIKACSSVYFSPETRALVGIFTASRAERSGKEEYRTPEMGEDLICDEADPCLTLITASARQPYIKDMFLFQSEEKSLSLSRNDSKPMKEIGRVFSKNEGKLEELYRKAFSDEAKNFRIL